MENYKISHCCKIRYSFNIASKNYNNYEKKEGMERLKQEKILEMKYAKNISKNRKITILFNKNYNWKP